jgi:hypothetical protein
VSSRLHWTARKFRSHAEAEAADLEFWRQVPVDARATAVWRLTEEAYRLANLFPDEPRLRRSVESVRRR